MAHWLSKNLTKLGIGDWMTENFPTINSTDNDHMADVVGNKTDTISGNSLVSKAKEISGITVTKSLQMQGNSATETDLFTITGACLIKGLYGIVTAIGAGGVGTDDTVNDLKLVTDDGGPGKIDLTLADSGLTGNADVGTVIMKDAASTVAFSIMRANGGNYVEGANSKMFQEGVVIKHQASPTSIQVSYTGDANTDLTINWVITYYPLTSSSSIVASA